MKSYSCRLFRSVDDMLIWLNKGQDYINVVSIIYLDKCCQYEVIYYT